MKQEYWGLSLDDLAEELYYAHELQNDATGAHYIAFAGTYDEARAKMIHVFSLLIERLLYQANSYGGRYSHDDEE